MLHSSIAVKELKTVGECLDAIEGIESDVQNYSQRDRQAFYDGAFCEPSARAKAKIASINKRMDSLTPDEDEEDEQMDVEETQGNAHVAYMRVSTADQNTDRQLADTGIKFSRIFTDKCSGGTVDRPQLEELKRYVRSGDTVHVHSIDRLARNLDDLRSLVNEWMAQGVTVAFHKEGLTFTSGDSSPMADLMLNMLGAVAQFERAMIRERQREGIEKAKAKGVYTGRKKAVNETAIVELLAKGVSIRKTAEQLGVGVSTVQRAKKAHEQAMEDAGIE